jgi:hypothetical protein
MSVMVPFRYVEFYDVPRAIALRYKGKLLLLQSAFDAELDEYPDNYSVYLVPEEAEASLEESSWSFMERLNLARIGEVAVRDVKFDPTKRHALDASILDDLMSNG